MVEPRKGVNVIDAVNVLMELILVGISMLGLRAYKKIDEKNYKSYRTWVVMVNVIGFLYFIYTLSPS